MWNFTGRQDDLQGKFNMHGNWISGVNFIDEMHLGISQENLPSDVLNNKARNTYYFLPLILGIIGLNTSLFFIPFSISRLLITSVQLINFNSIFDLIG